MKCPQCNSECWRDEVDIGVGVQCGPWQCSECGWHEGHEATPPTQQAAAEHPWTAEHVDRLDAMIVGRPATHHPLEIQTLRAARAELARRQELLQAAEHQLVAYWDEWGTCQCGFSTDHERPFDHAHGCPTARALEKETDHA